ncbi:DUF1801 domain-containing protein, partial [Fulvivirga sp. RKSG066]|nr:DUF1801 domain-containing protein [Fulvivirga aurantia]
MNSDTIKFNNQLAAEEKEICDTLALIIEESLPEAKNKIWHKHPVWFLE